MKPEIDTYRIIERETERERDRDRDRDGATERDRETEIMQKRGMREERKTGDRN